MPGAPRLAEGLAVALRAAEEAGVPKSKRVATLRVGGAWRAVGGRGGASARRAGAAGEAFVRAEAVQVAAGASQKVRARFEACVRRAPASAAALTALAALKAAPPVEVLGTLLVDPSAVTRAAACACVQAGPYPPPVEPGLIAALRAPYVGV